MTFELSKQKSKQSNPEEKGFILHPVLVLFCLVMGLWGVSWQVAQVWGAYLGGYEALTLQYNLYGEMMFELVFFTIIGFLFLIFALAYVIKLYRRFWK